MSRRREGITKSHLGQASNVTPQGDPLLLLLPHVRPLKQRHDELLRKAEDLHRRSDGGLHGFHPALQVRLSGTGMTSRRASRGHEEVGGVTPPPAPQRQEAIWASSLAPLTVMAARARPRCKCRRRIRRATPPAEAAGEA